MRFTPEQASDALWAVAGSLFWAAVFWGLLLYCLWDAGEWPFRRDEDDNECGPSG